MVFPDFFLQCTVVTSATHVLYGHSTALDATVRLVAGLTDTGEPPNPTYSPSSFTQLTLLTQPLQRLRSSPTSLPPCKPTPHPTPQSVIYPLNPKLLGPAVGGGGGFVGGGGGGLSWAGLG